MATKNIVPRGNLEGNLGTEQKRWSGAFIGNLDVSGKTKLTFANGIITDVATQAEAEAGTDNNTVMTPLRVKQSVQSFSNAIVGSNPITDVANDLPSAWRNIKYGRYYYDIFGLKEQPTQWGYIEHSGQYGDVVQVFKASNGRIWYRTGSNDTWTKWYKLATNGALSMPSAKVVNVSMPTIEANNTNWVVNDNFYVAPCDGWLSITANVNDGNKHCVELWCATNVYCKVSFVNQAWHSEYLLLPMSKGQVATMRYLNLAGYVGKFIYAQSEV